MSLAQHLGALRRRWLTAVLPALVCLALAGAFTTLQTPMYSARSQLFFSLRTENTDLSQLNQGASFTQDRVKSYSALVTSPEVLKAVIDSQKLPMTVDDLQDRVTVHNPLATVLLDITVSDSHAVRAASIANAIAMQSLTYIQQVETPTGAAISPLRVSMTDQALEPTSQDSPNLPINLAFGLAVGLALGIGVVLVRTALRTSIATPEDLEAVTESTPLGVVPHDPDAVRSPLVLSTHHSPRAEAYRTIRTNLQFADIDDPPRIIVITSPQQSEGKTTTACNLALTLGLNGVRTVLVDGDLRRPSVHTQLSLSNGTGLSSVLSGAHSLDDALMPFGSNVITVLSSGPSPPNPAELLGSQHMTRLLESLSARFDMVVIDSPPLLPVTDAAVLSAKADGALMVVRQGRTTRESVRRAMQSLTAANARLIGTVLTFSPRGMRGGNPYSGAGYGQASEQTAWAEAPGRSLLPSGAPQTQPLNLGQQR